MKIFSPNENDLVTLKRIIKKIKSRFTTFARDPEDVLFDVDDEIFVALTYERYLSLLARPAWPYSPNNWWYGYQPIQQPLTVTCESITSGSPPVGTTVIPQDTTNPRYFSQTVPLSVPSMDVTYNNVGAATYKFTTT